MNSICVKIALWYDNNMRDLPWRHTHDPYLIWLSEIILQQTRVAQGLGYYNRFVSAYPTVHDLAAASLDDVLKLWQGLGYYSRARHLHAAARSVTTFPCHYHELIRLPGVGTYTAAAVASFSCGEAVAVVDGNVYRVLSRLFDIDTPIDTPQGQKRYQQLADALLADVMAEAPSASSARHNQSLMEFGALLCTPAAPQCAACPVAEHCLALAHDTVTLRPVRQGKAKVRKRRFAYIIYIYKDTLWVHQRQAGDIWQGLWEFVLREDMPASALDAGARLLFCKQHKLTHQTLQAEFWVVRLPDDADPLLDARIMALPDGYRQVSWPEWQLYAVPRLIDEANSLLSAWF